MNYSLLHYKLSGKTFRNFHEKCKAERNVFFDKISCDKKSLQERFYGLGALVVIV
jgi:DNA-binding ferritin-like protein